MLPSACFSLFLQVSQWLTPSLRLSLSLKVTSSRRPILFICWIPKVQRMWNICILSYPERISGDILMYFIPPMFMDISFYEPAFMNQWHFHATRYSWTTASGRPCIVVQSAPAQGYCISYHNCTFIISISQMMKASVSCSSKMKILWQFFDRWT